MREHPQKLFYLDVFLILIQLVSFIHVHLYIVKVGASGYDNICCIPPRQPEFPISMEVGEAPYIKPKERSYKSDILT